MPAFVGDFALKFCIFRNKTAKITHQNKKLGYFTSLDPYSIQMKTRLALLIASAALSGHAIAATPLNPSLLTNGFFEQPSVAAGTSATFSNGGVPNWSTNCTITITRQAAPGTAYQGAQYAENAPGAGCYMTQTVATNPDLTYSACFAYSPKPGTNPSTNPLWLLWNNTPIQAVARDGSGLTAPGWLNYCVTGLKATSDQSVIGFINPNGGVSSGLIDGVKVKPF